MPSARALSAHGAPRELSASRRGGLRCARRHRSHDRSPHRARPQSPHEVGRAETSMETSRAAPPLARLSTARCGAPARPARGGHADTSHHNAQGARPRVRLRGVRVAPRVRHDTRSAVAHFFACHGWSGSTGSLLRSVFRSQPIYHLREPQANKHKIERYILAPTHLSPWRCPWQSSTPTWHDTDSTRTRPHGAVDRRL